LTLLPDEAIQFASSGFFTLRCDWETPMTYRGHVRNGQIKLDEPARLPEGAEVNVQLLEKNMQTNVVLSREQILRLPIEQRRQLLVEQANRLSPLYEDDEERLEWQAGDIVE